MNIASRRTFIKTAGASAAAVGAAVALAPSAAAGTAAGAPVAARGALPDAARGSMVAYIPDVTTGEISVLVEGHEVTVTDHRLVAKIAHILHSNSKL